MPKKPSTKEEYHKRMNLLVEYVHKHLGEQIDVESLARMSGFSQWHFHRITKAFLREPIGAYITRVRLETAAWMLRHTDLNVTDIAYRVGYEVPSSFSKGFRLFFGTSPINYRNNKDYTIMKKEQIDTQLNLEWEVGQCEPRKVAYIRHCGDYQSLDYMDAWKRIFQMLGQTGQPIPDDAEFICIYHDDPKVTDPSKLRTDICLGVGYDAKPCAEVGAKEIEGGKYAVFTYTGPYSSLDRVYDTVYGNIIPSNNLKIADKAGYELYLNSPENTPQDKLITQIYVPVE